MKVYVPESAEDFEKYYNLRWRILREPWQQPVGSEKDELEGEGIHVMVCEDDRIPLGVGRAHFNSTDEAMIRYMAVEETHQGRGIGKMILDELEKRAGQRGAINIVLNAREKAVGFYEKCDYKIVGKVHTLYGSIPHFKMKKILTQSS